MLVLTLIALGISLSSYINTTKQFDLSRMQSEKDRIYAWKKDSVNLRTTSDLFNEQLKQLFILDHDIENIHKVTSQQFELAKMIQNDQYENGQPLLQIVSFFLNDSTLPREVNVSFTVLNVGQRIANRCDLEPLIIPLDMTINRMQFSTASDFSRMFIPSWFHVYNGSVFNPDKHGIEGEYPIDLTQNESLTYNLTFTPIDSFTVYFIYCKTFNRRDAESRFIEKYANRLLKYYIIFVISTSEARRNLVFGQKKRFLASLEMTKRVLQQAANGFYQYAKLSKT